MKKISLIVIILSAGSLAFSQSKSYQALHDHFAGQEDVHTFSLNGFLCRAVLRIAMPEDKVLRAMARDIHHIRLMVIPKDAFGRQDLSVNGFKGYLLKDSFETLASIKEHGDQVSVFHRADNKKDRYFVLVEEPDEVVAIEMMGCIDPAIFRNEDHRITMQKR